jgi:hypothetical protein
MPTKDQNYYLRVLDRSYPAEFLDGIRDNPQGGYEIFQAAAKVAERVQLAITRAELGSYLLTAPDGAYATGSLALYHTANEVGYNYTLLTGSQFKTTDGKRFVTTAPVTIVNASSGPFTVAIRSMVQGYEFNVPGELTLDSGEILPGEITLVHKVFTSTPVLDATMTVRQLTATTGGVLPALDMQGADVGIPRQTSEPSDVYRQRIHDAPDTVSLPAIERAILTVLSTVGYTYTWILECQTTDLPGIFYDAGASTDASPLAANNYAYDMDPTARVEDTWKVYFSNADMRAFFIVYVPPVSVAEFGMMYDSITTTPAAYDTISTSATTAAYDGYPVVTSGVYKSLWAAIDAKRAGGVFFNLQVNPDY